MSHEKRHTMTPTDKPTFVKSVKGSATSGHSTDSDLDHEALKEDVHHVLSQAAQYGHGTKITVSYTSKTTGQRWTIRYDEEQ